MEGVMPMSFAFSDANARAVGRYVQQGLLPILTTISDQLTQLGRASVFQAAFMQVAVVMNGLRYVGLQVYIINPDLLESIGATRWAVANLSYVQIAEMLPLIDGIYRKLGQINDTLERNLALINNELRAGFLCVCDWLRRIWEKLGTGTSISQQIAFSIDVSSLSAFFASLDLGKLVKLLGIAAGFVLLLAATLAILAGFVYLLALALSQFTVLSLVAAAVVAGFTYVMVELFKTIAGFDWSALGRIAAGLGLIVSFVFLLAKTLSGYDWSAIGRIAAGLAAIGIFAVVITKVFAGYDWGTLKRIGAGLALVYTFVLLLTRTLAGYNWDAIGRIAVGMGAIVLFMTFLGLALKLFNADVLKAIPALSTLFDSLINLAKAIAGFKEEKLKTIGLGFLGIVVFLGALGLVLRLFNADVLNALPGLAKLFDSLINLAQAIASFTSDELMSIGLGLLGIVVFLGLLGLALGTFNVDVLNALPALSQLFDSLINLATAITNFTPMQLLAIGLAFGVITLFVWGLAAALRFAAGPLESLARIFESLDSIMTKVAGVLSEIGDLLGSVASGLGDLGGWLVGGLGDLVAPVSIGDKTIQSILSSSISSAGVPPPATPGIMPASLGFSGSEGGGSLFQTAAAIAAPTTGPTSQQVDQSVNVQGGITVNISADRLEANSAQMLSEEFLRQVQEGLGKLRANQDFRTGIRTSALA